MIKAENLFYDSDEIGCVIHAIKWLPDERTKPKAILIIAHGMGEHIRCYDEFARYMATMGVLVAGCDFLGHGESVKCRERIGYICRYNGNEVLIRDYHMLRKKMQAEYPDIPLFVMGHCVGSYLVREYIGRYGEGIKGAVVMGTGNPGWFSCIFRIFMSNMVGIVAGWTVSSRILYPFDNLYSRIKSPAEKCAWLTSVQHKLYERNHDPLCFGDLTANAMNISMKLILSCRKKSIREKIPKELSVCLLSGDGDPLGNYGKAPQEVFEDYKSLGIEDVQLKLYEGDRHALLIEKDRYMVYEDVFNFIKDRI